MKTICIINPVAGQGKALKVWSTIQEKVFSLGFKVDTVYTKYTGHATTLASHAVQQGYELVLAVGGDGTMHEVVKDVYKRQLLNLCTKPKPLPRAVVIIATQRTRE